MKSELLKDDLALDVRDDCLERHVSEFEKTLFSAHSERSDLRWLMTHFEIIFAVTSYCGQNLLDRGRVDKWKKRALELFDDDERTSDLTKLWRCRISDAFDRLITEISENEN